MTVSVYSVVTALIWFDLFILLAGFLRRKLGLFLGYNFFPLVLLVFLTTIRLLVPIELPGAIMLESKTIAPMLLRFFQKDIAKIGTFSLSVWVLCVLVASVVTFVLLLGLFFRIWRDGKPYKSVMPTKDTRIIQLMENIVKESKLKPSYTIIVSNDVSIPYLRGLLKPMIILPEKIVAMPDSEVSAVLRHEWQHQLSKDLWVKILIKILCYIMWWNPFVYVLKRNINRTLELKCDLNVTNTMNEEEKLNYLDSLIELFRAHNTSKIEEVKALIGIPFTGTAIKKIARKEEAFQRFTLVIEHGNRNRKIGAACIAVLSLLFALSFLFVIQPFFAPPVEDVTEFQGQLSEGDIVQLFETKLENSYIIDNRDGTYSLYLDNKLARYLSKEDMIHAPYNEFELVEKQAK